jgi:hypothetical protein
MAAPNSRRTVTIPTGKRHVRTHRNPDLLPLLPQDRAPAPFFLAHYEHSWEFVPGLGFIPTLSRYAAMPGVNGVSATGDLSKTEQGVASKGGVVIDRYDRRLLVEGEDISDESPLYYDYVRHYECTDGRRFHIEPGASPTVNRRGQILWNKAEALEYNRLFRRHLVDSSIVDPLHYLVYETLIHSQKDAVERLRGRVGRNPHLAERLEAAQAVFSGMEAEWARLTADDAEDEAPAPMKTRRSRKTAEVPA